MFTANHVSIESHIPIISYKKELKISRYLIFYFLEIYLLTHKILLKKKSFEKKKSIQTSKIGSFGEHPSIIAQKKLYY